MHLLLLLACTGADDGTGSQSNDDTAAVTDGGASDGGASDGGASDGGAGSWQSLPDECTPPDAATDDPFTLLVSEENTQEGGSWFTEILDVAMLPDEGRILTAGQGGLVVFEVDGTTITTGGHVGASDDGFSRYYHLLPIEPGYAWATHRTFGLDVVDITETTAPRRGHRTSLLTLEGLDRYGDHLYVAATAGDVIVFDVSDPLTPAEVGRVTDLGRPWDVHVAGEHAYVADYDLGLVTLSLAEPDAPELVHQVESAGLPFRLEAGDGALYMVSGAGGLEVFDLADPAAPSLVASLDPGGSSIDVAVGDGHLAVATQEAVVTYDLSDPLAPTPRAYEETEQYAMAIDWAAGDWTGGGAYGVGDWNILGLWALSEDQAPAIDASLDTVTFLDGAATTSFALRNRGGATLGLAGIAVPDGVTARVDRVEVAPGDEATVELTWDGTTELTTGLCIASDDPGRPTLELALETGAEGDGKAIGQQAPDFVLADLDGKTHRLSEQLGHPVVLAYFATW